MSKKRKKHASEAALRREIEALKAQLKEQEIKPDTTASRQTKYSPINYGYTDVKTSTKPIKYGKEGINATKLGEATYLKKDILKTMLFSFLIITVIVITKILNLF